jgi:hypothetical protein
MIITQKEQEFRPVTIILETRDELIAVWDALEGRDPADGEPTDGWKKIVAHLCNWFANSAKI